MNVINISFGSMAATSPNLIDTILPGLTIAVVGGSFVFLLNWAKDLLMERLKRNVEARVLAFSLVTEIDRLIAGCTDVVSDPLYMTESGYTETTVRSPTVDFSDSWSWSSFPVKLQYRIRSLPNKIYSANSSVSSLYEYGDGPPDYTDAYVERAFRFAEIGLEAIDLNSVLARGYGVPLLERGHWDPGAHFRKEVERIVAIRTEEAARPQPTAFWMLYTIEELHARRAKLNADLASAQERQRDRHPYVG